MRKIDDRTLTPAQKQKILEKYENTCGYCFGIAEEVDHILPFWQFMQNLRIACIGVIRSPRLHGHIL